MKKTLATLVLALLALTANAQEESSPMMKQRFDIYNHFRSYIDYRNDIASLESQPEEIKAQKNLAGLRAKADSLLALVSDEAIRFIEEYKGTAEGANTLFLYTEGICMRRIDVEKVERLLALYEGMDDNEDLLKVKANVMEYQARKPGQSAPSLTLQSPEGNDLSLADFVGKGKYVLVDCWASWCAPCCAELPKIKTEYEKYHEKSFEVVGISLDSNKEAWTNAIAKHELPWPQMSDLKGWDSAAAAAYCLSQIPFTALYDKDGRLIATDLRGEALSNALKEIFGE